MTTIERPMPPLNADERTTLESWLDFHRATLVQHLAEVERNWFRRVLAGEQAPPIYDPRADPNGPDGGFDLAEDATLAGALRWIYVHLIEEYARHNGHADLIRERIDGTTGV
jgi:Protein of unknown function (DUF664)